MLVAAGRISGGKVKTTKTKLLIGAAAITIIVVGMAFATPIVKLTSPLLSVGQQRANIFESGTAVGMNGQPFPPAPDTATMLPGFTVGCAAK